MDILRKNEKDVTMGDLMELQRLKEINAAMKESPECMNMERLIYDIHHTLLVNAYLVKGFINNIHFQETISDGDADYFFHELIMWIKLMEENKNPKEGIRDLYMQALIREVSYVGPKDQNSYPFLFSYEGIPYIPHWFALPLAKKALGVVTERIKRRGDTDV